MNHLTVRLGDLEVGYLPAGALIHAEEPIDNFDEWEDRRLSRHPRLRRIVLRVMPSWPLSCFYLHWSDERELLGLDERVAAGRATEGSFAGAVVGEAVGLLHQVCEAELRVVSLNPVLPLFADPIERASDHGGVPDCPICGDELPATVLEVISAKPAESS